MTLIAVAAHHDHAELVTDSFAMTNWGRYTSTLSKVQPLPHLDAAFTLQGDVEFFAAVAQVLAKPGRVRTFDELVAAATGLLDDCWTARWGDADTYDCIAFLVGHSTSRGRFVAYAFHSAHDFGPVDVTDDLFIFPAPLRSSAPTKPGSDLEWVELVTTAHEDRALDVLDTGRKVPFGGRIIHTRVEIGSIHQRTIHTLAHDGPEFEEMMRGFLHPSSQHGPCVCGSGRAFIDCCLEGDEEPCRCGSGATFANCCKAPPPATRSGSRVGRNEPCPCSSGRKHKHCCLSVSA